MRRLALAAALLLFAFTAEAKKVQFKWKPVGHATGYELQVLRSGKTVVQESLTDTAWKGDLTFGFYTYQIRALDKFKRASKWTQPLAFVVMPAAPDLTEPKDGTKSIVYTETGKAKLVWKSVKGVDRYLVEITRDKKPFLKKETDFNTIPLEKLQGGKYAWKVTGIVQPSKDAPDSIAQKRWETEPSDEFDFSIQTRKLAAAEQVEPKGTDEPPSDGNLRFAWKEVEGAEAYELVVIEHPSARSIASEREVARVTVRELVTRLPLSSEGVFTWKVRALASTALGPESSADFKLDRNANYFEGGGFLAGSLMAAPYTYKLVSPSLGFNGDMGAVSLTARFSGEYYYRPKWGVSLGLDLTQFWIGDEGFNRKNFDAMIKYRIRVGGDSSYAWTLSPKFGFEYRELHEISPDISNGNTENPTITSSKVSVLGPAFGFDLRRQFTEKLSLGIKLSYFKPFALLSAPSGASLGGDANGRNFSFGAQGLYWLDSKWGLGAGAFIENRSVSFRTLNAPNGRDDEVYMDGAYFFGSVIWRFGS